MYFGEIVFGNIAGAFILALGIAIQNIPEGAIISLPLRCIGMSRKKSFMYGVISGIVEPIAAVFTILLTSILTPILPYLLSLAAGAMIYVIVQDLVPRMNENNKSNLPIISFTIGFLLMMVLDVLLS